MFRKTYALILEKPLRHLLIFGLLLRVLILICYDGVTIFPDSKSYIELSTFLSDFSLKNYSGRRTPGFPSLISISGGNLYLTIILQQVIGLISIFLIYDFSYHKTQKKISAFWITFITSSFLPFAFYEIAILTETLSLFLTILIFWLIQKYNLLNSKSHIKYYIITSIVMGFLYLTRPMFIYFPAIFIVFIIIKNYRSGIKVYLLRALIIIIFPTISFYFWCSINKNNIGYFSSTYYFGYNLSQTATSFFEKVPDENKLIRDIFLKHREFVKNNEPKGQYPMTVWYAYDELIESTNLTPQDLSHKLGDISKDLFKKYPMLYLKQVFISWKDFWGAESTFLLRKENFRYIIPKYVVYGIWKIIQQYILILINILFILFSIKKAYTFTVSKFKVFDIDLLIAVIVIGGSIAQALVAYGNNSRFCFPYLPLIVYFVFINLFSLKSKKNTHYA